ncbi:unnamed protein product [Victoria cruziana]
MQSEKNMQKAGKPPEKPQGSNEVDPESFEEVGPEGSATFDDYDGIVAEKNKPAYLSNAKEHMEMRSHEVCRDDKSLGGERHLCQKGNMQSSGDQKLKSFSLDGTHQMRQIRSLCAEENNRKRQAIACAFFAKGWCIKGASCSFLHQNGSTGADAGKDSGEMNMLSNNQMEGPFQSADTVTSSGLLQKHVSLVHDGKSGRDDKLDDPRFFTHQANLSSGYRSEMEYEHVKPVINELQQSPFEKDDSRKRLMHCPILATPVHSSFTNEALKVCTSPFEVLPAHRTLSFPHQQLNSIQSGSEDLHFRNLERGARGAQETSGGCFLVSEVNRRPPPFDLPNLTVKNVSSLSNAPPYRFVSNGLSEYGISGDASSHSIYDKNGMQSVSPNQNSCSTKFDSIFKLDDGSSHMAKTSSVMPALGYEFNTNGSSYYGGIPPMSKLDCQTMYTLPGDDIEYSLSSSGSRPRNSPSYCTNSDNGKLLHSGAGDASASCGYSTSSYSYSWEPSVPFRSTFLPASARLSSSSRCDSIHDGIEPSSKGASGTSQASDFVKGNDLGTTLPEISSSSNVVTRFDDKRFQKVTSCHDATVGKEDYLPWDERKFLMPNKQICGTVNFADLQVASNTESHGDVANPMGDEKDVKEAKEMKCFRAALVDFVKELVRPSWHEGNLSKDAHKLVVKKTTDKVLSSMDSHPIPSNSEAIEQFLSLSRPKISKLVQGYVAKYAKAREATK